MLKTFVIFLNFCILLRQSRTEKLIVNLDGGADDVIALLLLLRHEALTTCDYEVIAITCSYGITNLQDVEKNVLMTLTIAGRQDIPVFSGAQHGFVQSTSTDNFINSYKSSDSNVDQDLANKIDRSKHAAFALVDLVRENAGDISIVSLGPLTNIGLATALDSNFTKNVKQFYVSGGSVAGLGNVRPGIEFNFLADPESNLALFNSVKEAQIMHLPLETTTSNFFTKVWRKNVLGKYDSPYIKFVNQIERTSSTNLTSKWTVADGILAASIIDKLLITSTNLINVDPIIDGKARGGLLVDYTMITKKVKNTRFIRTINHELLKDMLIRYLTCEQISC